MECSINNYTDKVIELFKSGKATDEQYKEMAFAVCEASENDLSSTEKIDDYLEQFFPELSGRFNVEDYPAHDC